MLQARVQELLGGGGANIRTISRSCVGAIPTPGDPRACSPGKVLEIEWFSCILVHFKVLIRVQLVTSYSV